MARVAIFDSGVGGLSIYQEIRQLCPQHQIVFISDNAAFPYGIKAEHELIERVLHVLDAVVARYQPDMLVVACNTASTVVLAQLRERFSFPIVGVVPAIKPAAKLSKSKVLGLLATPATINRPYTHDLIKRFANECHVVSVGSSDLVHIAEQKLSGGVIDCQQIEAELAPFLANPVLDSLVLACTHFPLLNKEIESIFNARNHFVDLIDSGSAIAQRVSQLSGDLNQKQAGEPHCDFAVMTSALYKKTLVSTLSTLGFARVEILNDGL